MIIVVRTLVLVFSLFTKMDASDKFKANFRLAYKIRVVNKFIELFETANELVKGLLV